MMLLDCDGFDTRIHELLDQRLPLELDVAMQTHFNRCQGCRQRYADYLVLTSALSAPQVELAVQQQAAWQQPSAREFGTGSARESSPARSRDLHRSRAAWMAGAGMTVAGMIAATALLVLVPLIDRGSHQAWSRAGVVWPSNETTGLNSKGRQDGLTALEWQPPVDAPESAGLFEFAGTSPQSMEIHVQAQQLMETIEGIPSSLSDLQPYYFYTVSFTGAATIAAPVSLTVDMLRRSLTPSPPSILPSSSDRGHRWSPAALLA